MLVVLLRVPSLLVLRVAHDWSRHQKNSSPQFFGRISPDFLLESGESFGVVVTESGQIQLQGVDQGAVVCDKFRGVGVLLIDKFFGAGRQRDYVHVAREHGQHSSEAAFNILRYHTDRL